jgi:hypothetical protein
LGAAAIFACSSDDKSSAPSGGTSGAAAPADGDGRAFYISKVHAQLAVTCQECHAFGKKGAPVFLGATAEASYTAMEGFPGLIAAPSYSPLVQKGVHSGPALTQTQSDLVTQWLKLEVASRKLDPDDNTPKNLRAAFKAFGQCMDYGKWKAYKLHTLPLTQSAVGQCRGCHNQGQGSLWLSGGTDDQQDIDDNAITFIKFTQFPYVQRLVTGRVRAASPDSKDEKAGDGAFAGLEASNRLIDKGNEAQQLNANSHPRFQQSAELANNLAKFVSETLDLMLQGPCTTSTVPDAGSYDAAAVKPITP